MMREVGFQRDVLVFRIFFLKNGSEVPSQVIWNKKNHLKKSAKTIFYFSCGLVEPEENYINRYSLLVRKNRLFHPSISLYVLFIYLPAYLPLCLSITQMYLSYSNSDCQWIFFKQQQNPCA